MDGIFAGVNVRKWEGGNVKMKKVKNDRTLSGDWRFNLIWRR